jgi:nickel-dependent lactate racemase
MPEIWVPYGPVEVSFDVKQENLISVAEPTVQKLAPEDIERQLMDSVAMSADSILVLSGTKAVSSMIDQIIAKSSLLRKLYHPKELTSFAKKKAQDNQGKIQSIELFKNESLVNSGEVIDGSPVQIQEQIKTSSNLLVLTSVHYDPLFGLTSVSSDTVSSSKELKSKAFVKSKGELPCNPGKSDASWYATRLLQTCPNVSAMEVVERNGTGVLGIFSGEPEAAHAKALDFWTRSLEVPLPTKCQRIVFGCGGENNDNSLAESLSRAFFNVVSNATLPDAGSRICMLADCSEGLGSEALFNYVTGKLNEGNLDESEYCEGLEVLISLKKVQKQLEVSLISTLPKYYGEKLGLKTMSGAKDAPSTVVPHGSKAKMLIVPDGSRTFFKQAS